MVAAPVVPAVIKACGELQRTAEYEALLRGSMMLCAAAEPSKGTTLSAPSSPAVTACKENCQGSKALAGLDLTLSGLPHGGIIQ